MSLFRHEIDLLHCYNYFSALPRTSEDFTVWLICDKPRSPQMNALSEFNSSDSVSDCFGRSICRRGPCRLCSLSSLAILWMCKVFSADWRWCMNTCGILIFASWSKPNSCKRTTTTTTLHHSPTQSLSGASKMCKHCLIRTTSVTV